METVKFYGKFYNKFCYNYVVWKLLNFTMINFILNFVITM